MQKVTKILIGVLIVLLIVSIGLNIHYNRVQRQTGRDTITTVTERVDTLRDTIPQIKFEKKIAVISDTFNVYKTVHDTINNTDYTVVDIPITQKTYSDDSTYTAYVSGYKQKLDSINVYRKTITIDRTITVTKKDNKKFAIGPTIFGGYDINGKKFGYGIGIGITYRLIGF